MRSALLTRAAVITASIATTAFMVTGTADAAATSPKSPKSHPTSLSILMPKAGAKHAPKAAAKQAPKAAAKHAPKGAKHRNKAMVRGLLKSGKEGLAREVVDLDRIAAGNKLTLVGKVVTNKAGVARFLVSRKSVAVKYVLVFKGSRALAPSHSGVVVVKAS